MRLWSLHPKYLDTKGLVALWREAILAKAVLEGKTLGYINHPQLKRFRDSENPVHYINLFLKYVYVDAVDRDYNFNKDKVDLVSHSSSLTVTDKQIKYELTHLLSKLEKRDRHKFDLLSSQENIDPNPLFKIIKGDLESWEVVNEKI